MILHIYTQGLKGWDVINISHERLQQQAIPVTIQDTAWTTHDILDLLGSAESNFFYQIFMRVFAAILLPFYLFFLFACAEKFNFLRSSLLINIIKVRDSIYLVMYLKGSVLIIVLQIIGMAS
jgi:hypothetical protein